MASTEHKRFMQQFEDFKEENGIDSGVGDTVTHV